MTLMRSGSRAQTRVGLLVIALASAVWSLAACSQPAGDLPAYSPQPSTGSSQPTRTASAVAPPPTTASSTTPTARPSRGTVKPTVTIDVSRVKASPALTGFEAAYRAYYTALATRDVATLHGLYPSFIQDLQDASGTSVINAVASGQYRFAPHGSISVMSVRADKTLPDTYQVQFCRSPRTQAYDGKTHTYYGLAKGQVAAHGYADGFTMARGGNGTYFFAEAPGPGNSNLCRSVTYKP